MRLLLARVLSRTTAALLLAGCFSGDPAPAEPPPPTPPTTATVVGNANANTFSPQTVTIARGGTVTWQVSTRPHNVAFLGATGAPANVPTGTNYEVARPFPTAGTFAYACTLHAGMIGTVVVQ
jgi:plastocyanin